MWTLPSQVHVQGGADRPMWHPHCHHSSHFLLGFIGELTGQPKCLENSSELDTVPMTRKRDGLCGSVMTPSWELSGVRTKHHTFKEKHTEGRFFGTLL